MKKLLIVLLINAKNKMLDIEFPINIFSKNHKNIYKLAISEIMRAKLYQCNCVKNYSF